jgi:hypothetical protein
MKPRSFALLSAACASLAGCAGPSVSASSPALEDTPLSGAATITSEDFHDRISFLASDALQGRDTPSEGLNAAAAYLVSEYERLGLEPGGEDGFYQWYPFPELALDTASAHFGTIAGGENRMLRYGTDFFLSAVPGGPADGRDMNHARLVYVGAATAELPAADYSGAAPVVAVPGAYDRTWRLAVSRARSAAQAAGATALVVVAAEDFPAETFRMLADRSKVAQRRIPAEGEIPVVYLTHRAAAGIAGNAGLDLAALNGSPPSPVAFEGVDAHFAATAANLDAGRAPNVLAILRGSDPALRDEYVVVSAHMDHVGIGRPVAGDSIYNGADDNASGTTALVEIAEALASLPERPRRSVVFLHVSGEEHGLLGSRWYSDHPTLPLAQTVANINIDMIARNSPDSVVVIGKDYSSLGQVVDAVAARHPEIGLVVSDDIWPEENFFFRSDHFNFARKEVPSIFFFSGVHEDYHQPSDEVHTLDTAKAARVARMVLHALVDIANAPARPTWDPAGLAEVRSLTR